MNSSAVYENELENALIRFEPRAISTGNASMCAVLRKKQQQISSARKAKDAKIYGELMQIESIASKCDSEQSKTIIDKVRALKALFAITILFFAVFSLNVQAVRTMRRDATRGGAIHRVIQKKEAA